MFKFVRKMQSRLICLSALILIFAVVAICCFALKKPSVKSSGTQNVITANTTTISAQSWGLSFNNNSNEPTPNLQAELLYPYNAFFRNGTSEKRIYLTFDAGYENGNTPAILDALKKHNAPATFFLVGPYVNDNPELVLRMANEGHILGNHTYNHPDMAQKSESEFKEELQKMEDTLTALTNKEMEKFYRPPQGKFTYENLEWAKSMGYKTVFWSLAYVDWEQDNQPSKETAFSKLLPRTHSGAIVLLHSTSSTNANILDELLSAWEAEGYTFGSLNELKVPTV